MDEHTFRVLEFDKVLRMAASFSITAPGAELVRNTRPLKNINEARARLGQVSECRKLFSQGERTGIEHFEDLTTVFKKVRPADAVLDPFQLRSFLPLFISADSLVRFSDNTLYAGLSAVVSGLTAHKALLSVINRSIDNDGMVLDKASPALADIRGSIRSCEIRIKRGLEAILADRSLAPHLQDHFIAERNNRWVIPVKRDSKGKVPGVVHDISNTGETVYVEPYPIQQLGNELESNRAEEKLEEYRILRNISALLREHIQEIEQDYRIVADVDAVQSYACFADRMDMSAPELNEKAHMKIVHGRHPLLWKALSADGRGQRLVPLDLEIGRDHSGMVITGSNTGGKTVTLKTTGVLVLMALSGMHIPADSGTAIPFLDAVYADIGDDQSIEENLSTFSAHIGRISGIIHGSRPNSLIIIDELGTGTDPEQGGALSCAILRKINRSGALTIVSTHLGMLKAFAHSEPGFINAAMEMNETGLNGDITCRPTYRLVMGEAGASHAFEMAASLGLGSDIISEAKEFITGEGGLVEELIAELKNKNAEAAVRLKEAEELKREAEKARASAEAELAGIKASGRTSMQKSYKEAEEVVRRAKVEADEMIRAIKKSGLNEAKAAAKKLGRKHAEFKAMQEIEDMPAIVNIKEGQKVSIRRMGMNGIVQTINEKSGSCRLLVNGKEITLPLTELCEPVKEKKPLNKRGDRFDPAGHLEDVYVPKQLNLVGQRVDPALSALERYLNDAAMAGLKEVRIIHGIGEGILSAAISEFLETHPLRVAFRKGEDDEGGAAVTVVSL